MYYVGIDIGSTASKVYVIGEKGIYFVLPTGWSSKETASLIKEKLYVEGIDVCSDDTIVTATGYGRVAVDYAGGQDTKVILIENGMVTDFLMNDKCSAGTGKFLEVMANRLGVSLEELFAMAEKKGKVLPISSLCTVFAESEVISYIGEGQPRENIAAGVVDSVANKVAQLCRKKPIGEQVVLTGGLSFSSYFTKILGQKIGARIEAREMGRYAGAYGAALLGREKYKKKQ